MTARQWWVRWPVLVLTSATVLASTRLPAQESSVATKQQASEARLRKDITYLASDELEGRGVTTKGINLAADHIASVFREAGLKPVAGQKDYFQPFTLNSSSAKLGNPNTMELRGDQGQELKLELGKQFQVAGLSGAGKLNVPVVFAGYGITLPKNGYDDYKDLDVEGKAVIVLRQVPRVDKPDPAFRGGANGQYAALTNKMSNAKKHKAAAVIFVNNTAMAKNGDTLMTFDYTAWGQASTLPTVHVQREVIDTLLQATLKKSLADVEKEIDSDLKPRSQVLEGWKADLEVNVQREKTAVKNVIGVLEGSGPLADETIVIGSHYDHLGMGGFGSLARNAAGKAIHHGADDNGSGTTTMLELARRFGAMQNRQGRRLVFMAFTAEEMGLIGSAHYCKHPLLPLDKTVAMINLDMVGRLRPDKKSKDGKDKLTVYGSGSSKALDELIKKLNPKHDFSLEIVPSIWVGVGSASDHTSFYMKKVPILFFFTGLHPDYHRPSDTSDKINVVGMRRIADLVEEIVTDLQAAPERPKYVEIPRAAGNQGQRGPRLGIVPNYNDDKDGVLIDQVSDGPASKAGLRGGDRIVAIAGKPVKNLQGFMVMMRSHKKGETLEVEFMRDGKKQTAKVKLE